jgi:glyceraldehyde 3-phosphate dehydrogenase
LIQNVFLTVFGSGLAFRVPVLNVSVLDFVVRIQKSASYDEIKDSMKRVAHGELKGIVAVTDDAVVSTDFIGHPASAIFDAEGGIMLNNRFAKLIAFYDNEWGYSKRVCDLLEYVAKKDAGK